MKFVTNKYGSKGVELAEKHSTNLSPMTIEDLLKKVQISYDKNNDIVVIDCDSNLLIKAENNIFISKNDTVILSGDEQGLKGKIHLNPILQKIKSLFS